MNTNNSFGILFFIRKERPNKKGEAPIYLRLTINGKRAEVALHRYIDPKKWDSTAGKVKGSLPETKQLNTYLDIVKSKIYEHHKDIVNNDEILSVTNLKNKFLGITTDQKTLIEVFKFHNKQINEQVGETFSLSTEKRYETTLKHTKEFIRYKYSIDDIQLKQLSYSFIADFEHYLKTVRHCNHNSTIKYLKNLRKIINLSVKNEWLSKDPFAKFEAKIHEVKRDFLTDEELQAIQEKKFATPRLDLVRDIFVFSCYTGLAYVDVAALTWDNISIGIDKRLWIFTERQKNKNVSNIPLLPKAVELANKYKNDPHTSLTNKVFPTLSNQKMNAYLKEIAETCGIKKTLTFHIARHTFATSVTLTKGISIEAISSMLGHKSIRTTQIYSKVVNEKVSREMNKLFDNNELSKENGKSTS